MLKDSRCPWMAGNVERPLNTLTACPSLRNFCDQKRTLVRLHMAQKAKDITQITFKGHSDVP